MKAMDIKTALQTCSRLKRKREEEDSDVIHDQGKVSKLNRTDNLDSEFDEGVCNGKANISHSEDVIICSEDLKTACNSNDKHNSTLENESESPDDKSSSSESDEELDSSLGGNESLDISTSSANISVPDFGPEDLLEKQKTRKSSPVSKVVDDNVLPKPKKKKRMTPEEAKAKTELRAQKERERELRKQYSLAKKEEKRLLKEKKEQEKKLILEERQKKKEQEEQLRREKKRQEELQKEEKNKQKQLALETKAEEKRKKEEQKQKALDEKLKAVEEKKKAEEEKKKAEEEKLRIEQEKERKTKEAFVNFFVRSRCSISQALPQSREVIFRPFQVTEGMILASSVPPEAQERFNKANLDQHLRNQDCQNLYLSDLGSQHYKSLKRSKRSDKKNLCDDELIVIDDKNAPELHLKAKLLQFHENLRPAYWGTWRKKSKSIHGRNPFGKDDILDYEVDSDDEWDEGGPGESLTGTEEEESEDEYEVDNEFFVPHGYLSAEEEGEDDDNPTQTDPEQLKIRLKMKENEFLHERKKKTIELKPIILGCFFDADGTEDIIAIEKSLLPYCAEFLTNNEIPMASTIASLTNSDIVGTANLESSPNDNKTKVLNLKRPVPEEGMPFLIKLLHANTNSRQFLINEFQAFWLSHCMKNMTSDPEVSMKISKRQLDITIQKISSWLKSPDPNFKRFCWWVREEIRQKYDCMDVPVPNQWNYVSTKEASNSQNGVAPTAKVSVPLENID